MPFDPAQLAALDAVLRHGSFDRAAEALSVTPSAISQRIRALEDRVGSALVIRATPCRATAIGARLARHAQEIALLDAALADELGQPGTAARVSLAVNADSLDTWVIGALARAGLVYDIRIDDQAHAADWLRRGEVSAAVTDQARPVQGCTAWPLGRLRYIATCSPAFRARHFARGVNAQSLAAAPMLQFDAKDTIQHDWLAAVAGHPLLPPCNRLPTTTGFVEATRVGLGWALNPEPLVAQALRSGTLVPLLPDRPHDIALIWQVQGRAAPALEPLTRAIRRRAAEVLHQP